MVNLNIPCPRCGKEGLELVFETQKEVEGLKYGVKVVKYVILPTIRCKSCGANFQMISSGSIVMFATVDVFKE